MNPITEAMIDLCCQIQQIAAPTFHEAERAAFVLARFQQEGLQEVQLDPAGNVLACLPGAEGKPNRPPVVSAHLDTVFPYEIDLRLERRPDRISGPGIGDNSLGLAGLFGQVWHLRQRGIRLPCDLWLAANVGEEGLGNLLGMKAVVDRFGDLPRAYIILEGLSIGQVYHRALGVRRYRMTITTGGGHSWNDFGKPSAVHVLTSLADRITHLKIPTTPRTSLNVGMISGGTSINTIAAQASLELDLRSEEARVLGDLAGQIEALAREYAAPDVTVLVKTIGERPSGEIPADHPLVALALDGLRRNGINPLLNIGSTDANVPLSRGLPAVTVGLAHGGGAHTVHEYAELDRLEQGMQALLALVEGAARLQG